MLLTDYSLRSLIPNKRNNKPTNATKQITPPFKKASVAAPQLGYVIATITATIMNTKPAKISNHLFIRVLFDFNL